MLQFYEVLQLSKYKQTPYTIRLISMPDDMLN